MRRLLLIALLIVTTSLAACGDDDDSAGGPSTTAGGGADDATVKVIAEDIGFPQDEYRAKAGAVDFVYTNTGSILHTLVIEDVGGFELSVSAKGDVDEGSVELEPGTYTLYCDVAGHRAAGMVADLVVE